MYLGKNEINYNKLILINFVAVVLGTQTVAGTWGSCTQDLALSFLANQAALVF